MPAYFFTQHAEECKDSKALSEFGIRTAISRGVNFQLDNFSQTIKNQMNHFRVKEQKIIYVSNDQKTWMTAVLMYYPYIYDSQAQQTVSADNKLTLIISHCLDINDKVPINEDRHVFDQFLKDYGIPSDHVVFENRDARTWGLNNFMIELISYEIAVCVTHHTTMQGFLSKMEVMDKSKYDFFKTMWSMAVNCDDRCIEIQEGVKSSSNDDCASYSALPVPTASKDPSRSTNEPSQSTQRNVLDASRPQNKPQELTL